MSELSFRSTGGTEFVAVDAGSRIAAVRADGGEVEIRGRDRASGAVRQWRTRPVEAEMGWTVPPKDAVWTEFRAAAPGATCFVQLDPVDADG